MSTYRQAPAEPSARAVKFGRIVLCVTGALVLGIGGLFTYFNPNREVFLTAACLGAGFILIWLGVALPRRVVAHLGFWLPMFLPLE